MGVAATYKLHGWLDSKGIVFKQAALQSCTVGLIA
jgi:hypothetical protein